MAVAEDVLEPAWYVFCFRVDGVNVLATVTACTQGPSYTLRYEGDDAGATALGVAENELSLALVLDEPAETVVATERPSALPPVAHPDAGAPRRSRPRGDVGERPPSSAGPPAATRAYCTHEVLE